MGMQNEQDQMLYVSAVYVSAVYVSAVWLALLEFCRMRGRIIRLGADALASDNDAVGRSTGLEAEITS
jgi:hypothetical protein